MLLADVDYGSFAWWSNFGVLGAIACIALYYLNDYWKLRKPYVRDKLAAEVEKERNANKLYTALTETEPVKMELLGQQKKLLESALAVQMAHASDCRVTREKVEEIHDKVVKGQ